LGVIPAVLDGRARDCIPSIFGKQHSLQKINLVDVLLACIIKVKCPCTKSPSVVSLETSYDTCIKRLNKRGQIRFKELKLDILWFI
jgi:hypothetical protein